MTIDIRYTSSEPNRLNKSITTLQRLQGSLRNSSNTIDPEILVEASIESLSGANYLTIYSFKRHYFIRRIESIRTDLCVIYAHVDVLTTYASTIRSNTAIIRRQANRFNLYLDDGVLKCYQNPIIQTYALPNEFSGLMYVMPVIG